MHDPVACPECRGLIQTSRDCLYRSEIPKPRSGERAAHKHVLPGSTHLMLRSIWVLPLHIIGCNTAGCYYDTTVGRVASPSAPARDQTIVISRCGRSPECRGAYSSDRSCSQTLLPGGLSALGVGLRPLGRSHMVGRGHAGASRWARWFVVSYFRLAAPFRP